MKKIGKRDVILGLLQNLTDDSVHPDEFTVSEYVATAKESGRSVSRKRAGESLNRMFSDGLLEKRQACVNSRIVSVYRKK
jgi:hypothetical protein